MCVYVYISLCAATDGAASVLGIKCVYIMLFVLVDFVFDTFEQLWVYKY